MDRLISFSSLVWSHVNHGACRPIFQVLQCTGLPWSEHRNYTMKYTEIKDIIMRDTYFAFQSKYTVLYFRFENSIRIYISLRHTLVIAPQ